MSSTHPLQARWAALAPREKLLVSAAAAVVGLALLWWLAVAPAWQGQRYGRSALMDALRRCGRSPMTVQADDALVGWYQRVGFKIVGRKPLPTGGYRYRLGWYAPRRPDEPGYGLH